MKAKKVLVWLCAAAMLVSAAGCGSSAASTGSDAAGGQGVQEAEGTAKEDLPLAKYPEEVTVHLGGSMNPNATPPMDLNIAAIGVIVPKFDLWSNGSEFRSTEKPSIRNAIAIKR